MCCVWGLYRDWETLQVDSPTHVTAIDKLFLLPYTSGVPYEYDPSKTLFFNDQIQDNIIPPKYGEFSKPGDGIVMYVDPGVFSSTSSQQDANGKAQDYLGTLISYVSSSTDAYTGIYLS